MTISRAAKTALAVLFMLLFLAGFGLRIWASANSSGTVGPMHVAAAADAIYVHFNSELLVLSPTGALRARQPIAALGLHDDPIDIRVLEDGRLLVAGQQPATLRLCEPSVWSCIEVAPEAAGKLRAQIKVLADVITGELTITDTAGNRVWRAPLAGGEPAALVEPPGLDHPNDLAFDDQGRLWVADSGNHRLAVYAPGETGAWALVHSLDVRPKPASPGNDWPMMLAPGGDGRWWVTQPGPAGERAELLVYHPERGAEARVALPEGADATDIARIDGGMLVTDMLRFRLYRVAGAGFEVTDFGDPALQALFDEAAAHKAEYQGLADLSLFAMIGFAVLMVLAAVWATPRGERLSPRPEAAAPLAATAAPAPKLREVYWLKRNPGTERLLRWLEPMSYLMVVVALGALALGYFFVMPAPGADAGPEKLAKHAEFRQLTLLLALVVGGFPVLMRIAIRSMRHRIGTDGMQLWVRFADGHQGAFRPEQLVYRGRFILYRSQAIAVQTGNRQSLYAAGEIETYIAPLLQRARKLGVLAMLRHQIGHREPVLVSTLVYVLVLTGTVVVTGAWRQLLPGLG